LVKVRLKLNTDLKIKIQHRIKLILGSGRESESGLAH